MDENIAKRLGKALQAEGYPAVRAVEVGLGAKLDPVVFRYTCAHHQAIITRDKDYLNSDKFPPPHPGILVARFPKNASIPNLIDAVLKALTELAGQDLSNKVYEITPDGVRPV